MNINMTDHMLMEEASAATAAAAAAADDDEVNKYANLAIPYDLFVSKKHKLVILNNNHYLSFTDSFGNLVYKVQTQSHNRKLLLDASSNCLFAMHHLSSGSWQGFKGNDSSNKLIFKVERTLNELTRTEFEIFHIGENGEDLKTDFKMKGSPFKRSCTIYKGDSILAESSLMYKLGIKKIFVTRSRFRVTIFPGFTDHALLVALIVIFFHGRKFWI